MGTFIPFSSALIGYQVTPEQELIMVWFLCRYLRLLRRWGPDRGGGPQSGLCPAGGWICDPEVDPVLI